MSFSLLMICLFQKTQMSAFKHQIGTYTLHFYISLSFICPICELFYFWVFYWITKGHTYTIIKTCYLWYITHFWCNVMHLFSSKDICPHVSIQILQRQSTISGIHIFIGKDVS